ncbi:hypothetical protein [Streptomyces sp. V1I6]|uniref:hypothetical protein n=1 Tax=Streptomyces sp. V1I6 TaxID=3042273 RepID=UPI0027D775A4|nr:hypothetical protein [Streptomyces sp. V1I6]
MYDLRSGTYVVTFADGATCEFTEKDLWSRRRPDERSRPAVASGPSNGKAGSLLRACARLLPAGERNDWLEEQRGYLNDLPAARERWAWVYGQVVAMPRLVWTIRSSSKKEPA